MQNSVAYIVLWLFVINLGIAFGSGLYEFRIVVPQWLSFSPGSGYRWNPAAATEAELDEGWPPYDAWATPDALCSSSSRTSSSVVCEKSRYQSPTA
jgi:hypothetical protein